MKVGLILKNKNENLSSVIRLFRAFADSNFSYKQIFSAKDRSCYYLVSDKGDYQKLLNRVTNAGYSIDSETRIFEVARLKGDKRNEITDFLDFITGEQK